MGAFPRTEVPQPKGADGQSGPFTSDQVIPTAIMFGVAMLAGGLAYWRKWKTGKAFSVVEFALELITSGVCGVVFYWIFLGLGVNEYLSAAGCAIVGHMGSRSLFIGKKIILGIFKV